MAQTTDLYALQHELESEMSALGTKRFHKALAEAREHGREASTTYGSRLIANEVVKVSNAIATYLEDISKDGRQARLAIAPRYLRLLPFDVAAFLGTKGVIDGITKRRRLQSVAVRIGKSLEDECRFQWFYRAQGTLADGSIGPMAGYANMLVEQLNKQTQDYDHKRRVLIHSMESKGVTWDRWPEDHLAHIGLKLVELVIKATGVAEIATVMVKKNRTETYLSTTPATLEWIKARVDWAEVMCPVYQPMVVPPKDWEGVTGGGYLNPWPGAETLVKTRNQTYLEELAFTDLRLVLGSLNAIQRTAYQVNPQVLDVMTEVWRKTNLCFGKLPSREDEEKPSKPVDIATNKEARKVWRKAASKVIQNNLKLGSRRLMVDSIIRTAEKFRPFESIYFPYNLDFRGRIYSIPSGLCPQGHDVAKGLLRFTNGKPLGNIQALHWLAIHGANLWGYDKVGLAERVAWVLQNEDNILASAANPLDYLWWTKADDGGKAWQFLAFCFEWAGYHREGLSFVSRLPVALDGSCNGLQHFSAMLRDPVGGAAVNLLPSEKPSDIYQTVCDRLIEKLKADGSQMAKLWLAFVLTRKSTKRPVMVVPYGGTRHSGREYIREHVKERLEKGDKNLWGDKKAIADACTFLSGFLWEAIRETVVAARDVMDWLQKVSQVVSKEEKPLNWTAPSGFKVQQAYPETKSRTIDTVISGQTTTTRVQLRLEEELPWLDKRRQAQGISPNFVHSLDAAALTFTVDAAVACGIENFQMIHDSYGTLAADTDTLRECLRQAFCQMYQDDVLKRFAEEVQAGLPDGVKLPPLPSKGTLDINAVLQSDFFFA
jgi:DNA-directed RNA polymerase